VRDFDQHTGNLDPAEKKNKRQKKNKNQKKIATDMPVDVYIDGFHVKFADKQLRSALFSNLYHVYPYSGARHSQKDYEYCAAHPFETVYMRRIKKFKQHLPFIQGMIDDAERLRLLSAEHCEIDVHVDGSLVTAAAAAATRRARARALAPVQLPALHAVGRANDDPHVAVQAAALGANLVQRGALCRALASTPQPTRARKCTVC
jgi:hypothetical protein